LFRYFDILLDFFVFLRLCSLLSCTC
jgi:hypothetical protein